MKIIKFESDEIWPLSNILNEVCNGISIDNFEKKFGNKKEFFVDLLDRMSKEEQEKEAIIKLSDSDLEILKQSFDEVFKKIDEWEFQTRIGITVQEAKKIISKLT